LPSRLPEIAILQIIAVDMLWFEIIEKHAIINALNVYQEQVL
jgi:hypothetical protein